MPVIDADAHVEESPATFADPHWDAAFTERRPQVVQARESGVHVGWPSPTLASVYDSLVLPFTVSMFTGFLDILAGGVLDRFPKLRVCFFEVGKVPGVEVLRRGRRSS